MKTSSSHKNLENLNSKKRKRDLSLCNVYSLPCNICSKEVQDYKRCIYVFVYCNIDCLENRISTTLISCNS